MAGLGSVLGLLGFGAEHVATSGAGILGSLLGAGLGGGLLAAGAGGTMAVGMGTDMAGMGQAANDIKAVYAAQNNLNQAIAVYGKNSYQAVAAQKQLNYTLSSFSPIAKGAVLAAANTAQAFRQMFIAATGEAEKIGAQIIQEAMKVGMKFLPTIGKFAAENMGIIQKDIQPLFSWMDNSGKSGGLGIFTQLEKIFQGQLPMGIHALTQGIELFAKTISVAARYTGGFLKSINNFLTHANSAKGFAGWSKMIGTLIGLFKTWLHLLGSVIGLVADLFKPAVGLGKAFAELLTNIIDQIRKWLTLGSTRSSLHNLFSAHLQELIKGIGGIIKALLPAVEGIADGFLKMAGAGARIAADLLKPLAYLLKWVTHFGAVTKALSWGTEIFLGVKAFQALKSVGVSALQGLMKVWSALPANISGLKSAITSWASTSVSAIKTVALRFAALVFGEEAVTGATTAMKVAMVAASAAGILVVAAGVYELIHHFGVLHGLIYAGAIAVGALTIAMWALDAVPVVAVIAGITLGTAALVAGIIELVKHWRTVWADVKNIVANLPSYLARIWDDVVKGAEAIWGGLMRFFRSTVGKDVLAFLGAPFDLVWHLIDGAMHRIASGVVSDWDGIVSFMRSIPHRIYDGMVDLGRLLEGLASDAWHSFLSTSKQQISDVLGFVKSIPGRILRSLGDIGNLLVHAGEAIMHGFLSGIQHAWHDVTSFFGGVASWISKNKGPVEADAVLLVPHGQAIMQGLLLGTMKGEAAQLAFFRGLIAKIADVFLGFMPLFHAVGEQMMQALAAGIQAGTAAALAQVVMASRQLSVAAQGGVGGVSSGVSGRPSAAPITINSTLNFQAGNGSPADIKQIVTQAFDQRDKQLLGRIRAGSAY
ncbi:MAG: phage tail family protein [Acidimicrobiales bacterium]